MRKLLLVLLIIICLVGCGKKEEILSNNEVVLEGIKYTLDQDEEEYGIKYKIASNFRKSVMINAINYFSEKIDDQEYFVIRIFHYKNRSTDYAIKDSTTEYDKKWEEKINGLDYTAVHFLNFSKTDVNIYYHKHKNDVYAFVFTARIDLTRLKDIFLTNINYE